MTDSDAVTPRILVKTRLYRTRSRERIDHIAYDAVSVGGTIGSGPGYERDVIGYVEVPPNTRIGRTEDFDAFRTLLYDVAEYVHIKDEVGAGDA